MRVSPTDGDYKIEFLMAKNMKFNLQLVLYLVVFVSNKCSL